jgi:flagellar biosynthesis protein
MPDKPHSDKASSRKKAVALRYDPTHDQVPVLIGKGAGVLAEKIISLAREHGIPIQEDPDLLEILSQLELQTEIPPETYLVVAEILALVYRANEDYRPD